ncbi:MAG: amidohydrolase family protein [Anaerolineales bacterium]
MQDSIFIEDYCPIPEVVTPVHEVRWPKFEVVDGHNHLPVNHPRFANYDLDELVAVMDEVRVKTIVNLSGGWGDDLQRSIDKLDAAYPGRFCTFCNVHWGGAGAPGWTEAATRQLAADVAAGAKGLKIFKQLGLYWRDCDDKLLMPDDPRLSDVFEQCAELGIPVLIHAADPTAFFKPLDRFNERWDELHGHPDWHFYGPQYPRFMELIESLYRLIEAHPQTTFITAHVGCYPENLAYVSQMLDKYPNFNTDISARIAELGRVPYSAREWFIKYADRIIFGTDNTPSAELYRLHYRFLETKDEYFSYSPRSRRGGQGRFNIYGLYLPDDVLEKVYNGNFHRLVGM